MNVLGHAPKCSLVLAHMLDEGRTPRRQRHRVNQREAAVVPAVQQMRTQRCGAAKIVCDDIGLLESPMFEQFAEYDVLYAERNVLVFGLLRFPVAQQVETVNGVCVDEVWSNAVPHMRGKRCAVYEYERGTRAPDRVANGLAPKAIGLVVRHVLARRGPRAPARGAVLLTSGSFTTLRRC